MIDTRRALPIELLGHIVQFSELAAQLSLACVSRAFNAETNRVLYSSVRISTTRAASAFARTTTARASLGGIVRALVIDLPAPGAVCDCFDLACLVNLRHLSIDAFAHPSKLLQRVRDDQLHSFTASYIWRDSTDELPSFLARQRHLTRLSLDQCCFLDDQAVPRLESLECPPSLVVALGPIRPLRDLTILGTVEGRSLDKVICAIPSSLRTLSVTLDDGCFPHLFDIADALPLLHVLKLDNVMLSDFEAIATSQKLPQLPALLRFDIQLYGDGDIPLDVVLPSCKAFYTNWKKNAAPKLDHVNVSFEDYDLQGIYTVDGSEDSATRKKVRPIAVN